MTSKVIVVVGASRGIGRELVHQFSAYKSNTVIALSRNLEAMEAQFTAENIHCAHLDLMDEDLHDALDKVLKQFPTIDIVVNNAGKLVNKPDRKSTRLNSSHVRISYAVFCLKK